MARTAVCIRGKGRTPGAGGGAGSDVVDVGSALHPTALPCPLVCLPCAPLADGTWRGV